MKKLFWLFTFVLSLLVLACAREGQVNTATAIAATAQPSPTSMATPTPTRTPAPVQPAPTATVAPAIVPSATPALSPVATPSPRLEVSPATAAPGESVTVRGSGWPAGASMVVRMYEEYGAQGAGLGGTVQADAQGNFTLQGIVPRTLFGPSNRENLTVYPREYVIVDRLPGGIGASVNFTVGPSRTGGLLWGEVYLDTNGNGQRDDPGMGRDDLDTEAIALLSIRGSTGAPPLQAFTDMRGRYALFPVPPGAYTVSTEVQFQDAAWSGNVTVNVQGGQVARADLLLTR